MAIIDEKDYAGWQSKTCKRTFEKMYIPTSKRTDSQSYAKLFTRPVLEEARNRLPELDLLITFITG